MNIRWNKTTILFFFITLINFSIFFFRDKFIYHKYGTRSSLYSNDTLKWKKFVYDYSKRELIEAKAIIDSLTDLKNKSTILKILEIDKLLYVRFHKQLGKPSPATATATPINQFKILSGSDSAQLWCGDFAAMLAFFCWSQGIPCRVIEIMNPGDHHVLNECYLTESNEWVLTDITTDHLLIFNKNKNKFENLLDLRDSLSGPLQSFQATGNGVVVDSFPMDFYNRYWGIENNINYYYRINNFEVYKTSEKIKRYFLPVAWYEEVNKTPSGNFYFYVKQFFILLWLIFLILFIQQFIIAGKFKKI